MTQNSKFNQNTFLHSWITVFDPMYIAKLVRHIKYLILETQRTSSSKLRNFQCPVAWKLDHFGGRTTSFIHPSTVKHRIWAGPENIKNKKANYLERLKKYFSSITKWMPETYMSCSWFLLRGDLSSCTTRNFVVKFCLQYTAHFQNSCAWEIYIWSNRVLYLNVLYSYNFLYKYKVLEMSIPWAVADWITWYNDNKIIVVVWIIDYRRKIKLPYILTLNRNSRDVCFSK